MTKKKKAKRINPLNISVKSETENGKVILTFSDTHFDTTNSRRLMREMNFLMKYIAKHGSNIDAVVFCGDYFHRKLELVDEASHHSVMAMSRMIKVCKRAGIEKFRMIQGTKTHDFNQLNVFDSYESDSEIDFRIIRRVEVEDLFEDFKVLYLPEEYPTDPDEYYQEYITDVEDGTYNAIFGHGNIDFAVWFVDDVSIDQFERNINQKVVFSAKELSRITTGYTSFGHIHNKKSHGRVFYNGSFSTNTFADTGDEKGFYLQVHDPTDPSKDSLTFIHNYLAPVFRRFSIDNLIKKGETIESIVKKMTNSMEKRPNDRFLLEYSDEYAAENEASLAILNELRKKNLFIRSETGKSMKKLTESEDAEENESVSDTHQYLFDPSVPFENKISRFLSEEIGYETDPETIVEVLISDDEIAKKSNPQASNA